MKNKLQNIKAVKELLDGTHKFQNRIITAVPSANKSEDIKAVGETWEEEDSKTGIKYLFEQKEGYQIKQVFNSAKLQDLRHDLQVFINCPKETCTCIKPNHLDHKMKSFHEMCYDCVIEMETQLKLDGKFDEYAINKMKANALAWIEQTDKEVELLKKAYTTSQQIPINEKGDIEHIDKRMSPEEFKETIEAQYNEFKTKFMENIEKMGKENESA